MHMTQFPFPGSFLVLLGAMMLYLHVLMPLPRLCGVLPLDACNTFYCFISYVVHNILQQSPASGVNWSDLIERSLQSFLIFGSTCTYFMAQPHTKIIMTIQYRPRQPLHTSFLHQPPDLLLHRHAVKL